MIRGSKDAEFPFWVAEVTTVQAGAEVWIPVFRLPVNISSALTITRFVVSQTGNLFLDHGGLAPCENIISRSYRCSCRPF
jgi:hypothetical protein